MDKKIELWIVEHTKELVQDIQSLVKIRSVSSKREGVYPYGVGCYQALEQFLSLGEKYGMKTQNHDNHCGSIFLGEGAKTIGLWGHLDIVPEGGDWMHSPYHPVYKKDFLIGRGVSDNKGPCVAGLYALRFLKENNISLSYRLQLTGGCDEEAGMQDIKYYLQHFTAPDYSLVLDAGFPVCYGEKGLAEVVLTSSSLSGILDFYAGDVSNKIPEEATAVLPAISSVLEWSQKLPEDFHVLHKDNTLVVQAKGKSGHVAFPEGAKNAIGLLASQLCKLKCSPKQARILGLLADITADGYGESWGMAQKDEISGPLTCSGSVLRMHNNALELTLNIRYPITANFTSIQNAIQVKAAKHGYTAKVLSNRSAYYTDPQTPWIQALLAVYKEETGDDAAPYTMGGGTYAGQLPNAVAFGPGLPTDLSALQLPDGHGGGHAPDEAQSIPNLQKALKIYIKSLLELDRILNLK